MVAAQLCPPRDRASHPVLSQYVVWDRLCSFLCSQRAAWHEGWCLPIAIAIPSAALPSLPPQSREWWQCPRRCAWCRTTPLPCPSWRSTSSAVPRRASSTTTPSPVTTTDWPLCRHVGPKPATRYRVGRGRAPGAASMVCVLGKGVGP